MTLVETLEDVEALEPEDPENLAFLTQTTLSVDDTRSIVEALYDRFPNIVGPKGEDICYATSNRQDAAKKIAAASDLVLVIGAPNSSNSLRLVEVAEREGATAYLIQRADEIDHGMDGPASKTLGLTAGASAPEILVREVITELKKTFTVHEEKIRTAKERMVFKLPRGLEAA